MQRRVHWIWPPKVTQMDSFHPAGVWIGMPGELLQSHLPFEAGSLLFGQLAQLLHWF